MDFIIQKGFLGTNSPFFIDFSLIIMSILPLIMVGSIFLARKELIKLHIKIHISSFSLATIILSLNIYGYIKLDVDSLQNPILFYVYLIYLSISYIVWYRTIYFAMEDSRRRALPGLYSKFHKKSGMFLIILVSSNIFIGLIFYYFNFLS
jgi:hypothetical protein